MWRRIKAGEVPEPLIGEKALQAALKFFWEHGYEPASVAELCKAMDINAPSIYCSFGNKAALFLEAVRYYESKYWTEPAERFMADPDIYKAVDNYFNDSVKMLLSPLFI